MFTSTLSTAFAALNYTYDANGNATTDGKYCYQYNEANQLKRVTICNGGQIVSDYIYDYNGNRIEKKIYNGGLLQKTAYSPNDSFETTKLASNGATTNVSYYFVNDELVAKKNSDGSKNYFLNDHLGSITNIANSSGALIETTQYYPYGLVRAGGTKNKFLYTGQENDPETGLDYYNFRYYSPQLGRFIQPDDALQTPYDPQSLNNYSYVNNNPLKYTDPSGHQLQLIAIPIFAYISYYVFVGNTKYIYTALQKTFKYVLTYVYSKTAQTTKAPSNKNVSGNNSKTRLPNPFKNLSKEAIAGSITYSYHALQQRMLPSNVSKDSVVQTLQQGVRTAGNDIGTSVYELSSQLSNTGRGIRVVINDATKNIITVTDKGSKFIPK